MKLPLNEQFVSWACKSGLEQILVQGIRESIDHRRKGQPLDQFFRKLGPSVGARINILPELTVRSICLPFIVAVIWERSRPTSEPEGPNRPKAINGGISVLPFDHTEKERILTIRNSSSETKGHGFRAVSVMATVCG